MRRCPTCEQDLELSDYGVDRSRRDGLQRYCKVCIRQKVYDSRKRKKAYAQAHKLHRKPCRVAEPLWRKNLSPRTKVVLALERGKCSQRAIRGATRLPIDQITDILAVLYDENQLDRRSLKARVYRLCG